MEAPLVPRTLPEDWTVVHDDGGVSRGSGGRVAFTSRKAFGAVGDDLVVQDREWGWRSRANSEDVQLMSLTPNMNVLVLDEAWGWKFSGECPQMRSAKDGRAVLRKLLRGRTTPAQRDIAMFASNYRFFVGSTSSRKLCYLTYLRKVWELYRRADEWSPNNRSDDEGNLVFQPSYEWYWVLTSPESELLNWSCISSGELPPNAELMVLEHSAANLDHVWKSEPVTRTAPAYLSFA